MLDYFAIWDYFVWDYFCLGLFCPDTEFQAPAYSQVAMIFSVVHNQFLIVSPPQGFSSYAINERSFSDFYKVH